MWRIQILDQSKMICNSLLTIYLHLIEINLFIIFDDVIISKINQNNQHESIIYHATHKLQFIP